MSSRLPRVQPPAGSRCCPCHQADSYGKDERSRGCLPPTVHSTSKLQNIGEEAEQSRSRAKKQEPKDIQQI